MRIECRWTDLLLYAKVDEELGLFTAQLGRDAVRLLQVLPLPLVVESRVRVKCRLELAV
jgi:hypothetical protein